MLWHLHFDGVSVYECVSMNGAREEYSVTRSRLEYVCGEQECEVTMDD